MSIDPQTEITSVLPAQDAESLLNVHPPIDPTNRFEDESEVPIQQLGQFALIWRRFRRHKIALIGGAMFLAICLIALIGPWISPEGSALTWHDQLHNWRPNYQPHLNFRYLFGTDEYSHSVMMYVLLGARTSLEVGMGSALMATVAGIVIGAISGYFGGFTDGVMMRVTDVFLTLPFLPLLLLLSAFLGNGGIEFIILIFGVLGWPGIARLIRSYYLSFREQEFVDAARAVGVSPFRIIFRHIMPNALSPVIVSFTLAVAAYISSEAAIDFLGLGLRFPQVSWGIALSGAEQAILVGNWWIMVFPGLALLVTVLSVNFLGDGLRDALDVKAKVVE